MLSNPSCGKLDLRWTGPWTVTELKGPTSVTTDKDENVRMNCDTNRLTLLLEPPSEPLRVFVDWCPLLFEHQEDNESPVRP